MGIHCCTPLCKPDPGTQRMDYFGPPVNLSARISGYGKGGQIVISKETFDELGLETKSEGKRHICDMAITSLGGINLKGIRESKQLFEVIPNALFSREETFEAAAREASSSPKASQSPAHSTEGRFTSPQGEEASKVAYSVPFTPKGSCKLCDFVFTTDAQLFCSSCGTRRTFDFSEL